MKIVFFGTPSFAVEILDHIVQEGRHEIVAIVSKPDKPRGRDLRPQPTEIHAYHTNHLAHIPLFQPAKVSCEEMASSLKELNADVFVVVAYGEIMKPIILNIPKYGCINVHASLLPYFRGAAPMQRAILQGVVETGVTIMRMDPGLDSGDILMMTKISVPQDMNMGQLYLKMAEAAKKSLSESLIQIEEGRAEYIRQDHTKMTMAPKIMPEECYLDFKTMGAKTLHNIIRAFSPKPGAYCFVLVRGEKKRLKITQSQVVPKNKSRSFQAVTVTEEGDGLYCFLPQDVEYDLRILRLQLEGKKEMFVREFLQGARLEDFVF